MQAKPIGFLFKNEKYFFYAILALNIFFVFNSKFHPTMDGPAHLHNSFLLKNYLSGSDFTHHYYTLNNISIPNWFSHLIFSFSLFFLSPCNSEKLIIILYIILFAVSFRYFIKQIEPRNLLGSLLIFPFIYTFLFYLGFFNFCFSVSFMFFAFAFYIKNSTSLAIKNSFILFCLISLTYFSNVLGFIYLLLIIFSFSFIVYFKSKSDFKFDNLKLYTKHLVKLVLICLLPIVCFLLFYFNVTFFHSDNHYKFTELLDWLFNIRSIIVYDYIEDKKYTQFLLLGIIMAFSISIYLFIKKGSFIFTRSFVLFLILILTLILFIYLPDGASAGMMSDRLCVMFFLLLLALLVSFPIPQKVLLSLVLVSTFVHISLYQKNHLRVITDLSKDAEKIYNCSVKIKDRSIVLPINFSDNWLQGHFSNYLAVNKELLILENYEANVGWFPLKWNKDKLPKFKLGTKESIGNFFWNINTESKVERKIDYVFLYGNTSKLDLPENQELKTQLQENYKLDESITDPYIKLYCIK